jgi:hypothetical protein
MELYLLTHAILTPAKGVRESLPRSSTLHITDINRSTICCIFIAVPVSRFRRYSSFYSFSLRRQKGILTHTLPEVTYEDTGRIHTGYD